MAPFFLLFSYQEYIFFYYTTKHIRPQGVENRASRPLSQTPSCRPTLQALQPIHLNALSARRCHLFNTAISKINHLHELLPREKE
ncbi:hypothetical protein N7475_001671 [Penicillium sp. IBT 31633x]|nr:hypothetical protein N7475_001671 [Penicillium sp. IBT 31633x]